MLEGCAYSETLRIEMANLGRDVVVFTLSGTP
jgi:hypothetical protein